MPKTYRTLNLSLPITTAERVEIELAHKDKAGALKSLGKAASAWLKQYSDRAQEKADAEKAKHKAEVKAAKEKRHAAAVAKKEKRRLEIQARKSVRKSIRLYRAQLTVVELTGGETKELLGKIAAAQAELEKLRKPAKGNPDA